MAEEPDNILLRLLRDIRAKQDEHDKRFDAHDKRFDDLDKAIEDWKETTATVWDLRRTPTSGMRR